MRKITLLLSLFSVLAINAQLITITETYQIPQNGDTIHYQKANTFGFDKDGVGVVTDKLWDFHALMNDGNEDIQFWWTAPTGLAGADSFPTANIARGGTTENGYFFYNNSTTELNRIGWYGDATNFGIYRNSFATEFKFPFTAGDNNSVSYSGRYAPFNLGEDSVTIELGNISLQADMQGTLILPTGEFHNVLRIHDVESFHLKAYIAGTPATDNLIEDDYYYWFVDTIFQPILIYGTTAIDGSEQAEVLRYQPIDVPTNVLENTLNDKIKIYPNPSNGIFEIQGENINSVKIIDIKGEQIKTEIKNFKKIDLTEMEKGIYFAKIYTNNGIVIRKIVLE